MHFGIYIKFHSYRELLSYCINLLTLNYCKIGNMPIQTMGIFYISEMSEIKHHEFSYIVRMHDIVNRCVLFPIILLFTCNNLHIQILCAQRSKYVPFWLNILPLVPTVGTNSRSCGWYWCHYWFASCHYWCDVITDRAVVDFVWRRILRFIQWIDQCVICFWSPWWPFDYVAIPPNEPDYDN